MACSICGGHGHNRRTCGQWRSTGRGWGRAGRAARITSTNGCITVIAGWLFASCAIGTVVAKWDDCLGQEPVVLDRVRPASSASASDGAPLAQSAPPPVQRKPPPAAAAPPSASTGLRKPVVLTR